MVLDKLARRLQNLADWCTRPYAFITVDASLVVLIQNLKRPVAAEIVPTPLDECLDSLSNAGHEQGMYNQPRCKRDRAVEFVPFLPTAAIAAWRPIIAMIPYRGSETEFESHPRYRPGYSLQPIPPHCCATKPSCGRGCPSGPAMFAKSPQRETR